MAIQKPKGTIDILPDEIPLWHKTEAVIRSVTSRYGFREIRFPTFEYSTLFKRGVGDTTDIVQKEMFTLDDRDGNELCLRPEGTAGVVRSVIENGLYNEPMPLKLYYVGPFFRYEKPQAGRSREFFQFGTELFGTAKASADAMVISVAASVFEELGIHTTLNINSIGCKKCRPLYHAALKEYFAANEKELCDTCHERLKTNPLRILDCKSPECGKIADKAPKTVDHLCDECAQHFEELKKSLDIMGLSYEINPRIVRGLDYYVRTVFEFLSDDIGAQSTVCGGGRYDGLVSSLDGPELSGIGFGMGLTRLMMAMRANAEKSGETLPENAKPLLYIAPMGEGAETEALRITNRLRKNSIYAETDITGRSLKAQMKYADKIGAQFAIVIGDNELAAGAAEMKNLRNGEKQTIKLSDITETLKNIEK